MSGALNWSSVAVDVRRAMTPKGRAQLGRMVVEGKRLLLRAVRAGCAPSHLLVARSLFEDSASGAAEVLAAVEGSGCQILQVPDDALLDLSEGRNSGLLLGLCEMPDVRARDLGFPRLDGPVLCLVNVEEPGNIGAMVRTALASGAKAVIAVGGCDLFHPKAIRTSLGSLFTLPLVRLNRIDDALEMTEGMTRIAAVAQEGRAPWEVTIAKPPALFMGNEGSGLPSEVVSRLDEPVTIPMPEGVDSFSVNAAAAVLLYELRRRQMVAGPR